MLSCDCRACLIVLSWLSCRDCLVVVIVLSWFSSRDCLVVVIVLSWDCHLRENEKDPSCPLPLTLNCVCERRMKRRRPARAFLFPYPCLALPCSACILRRRMVEVDGSREGVGGVRWSHFPIWSTPVLPTFFDIILNSQRHLKFKGATSKVGFLPRLLFNINSTQKIIRVSLVSVFVYASS